MNFLFLEEYTNRKHICKTLQVLSKQLTHSFNLKKIFSTNMEFSYSCFTHETRNEISDE